jgi:Ni/Fe-hydrogenase subunit HybB-like protein
MSTFIGTTTRREGQSLFSFVLGELKPRGRWLTPFNVISLPVMLLGAGLLVVRFAYGLGSITNLDQNYPWGLWIGFDVVTGVALAGGAYVMTFLVYVLRLEQYRPIVRVVVLNGLLAYMFYAGALLLDLGRPWKVVNPIIGNSFGLSSVLFLVAWHFMLYMLAELIEFSPTVAEWLGLERARRILKGMTLAAVIFGITLSMLHQSGLGALYLMARDKIHPLWYSEFIPILFLVSSVFAGLSMVIVEGTISRRVFTGVSHRGHDAIVIGLSRICGGTMFVYLFLKALVFIHGRREALLFTPMGAWFLLEMVGFVALPCVLFVIAVRSGRLRLCQVAAGLTLAGVILNRLNVTVIGFKWYETVRYVPSWMEIVVTLAVVFAEIWVFRWIVTRMPVFQRASGEARGAERVTPALREAS